MISVVIELLCTYFAIFEADWLLHYSNCRCYSGVKGS